MEENELLQDSSKHGDKEEHKEEGKERINHPLTPSNSKPIIDIPIFNNDFYDAHVLDKLSEEDSCLTIERIHSDELKMDISYDNCNTNMQENPSDNAFVMKSKER